MRKKFFLVFTAIFTFISANIIAQERNMSYKIGDKGPGGGIVFYIEGNKFYEVSEVLGTTTWYDAFKLCKNYRGGGYDDWYLPTKDELNLIYQNLRKRGKISENDWHWSSSQCSYHNAWVQRISDDFQDNVFENSRHCCVRAVRAF